ncbi:MAG: hypothetical protein ACLGIF_08135, partial [Actinomycetes bacterium]
MTDPAADERVLERRSLLRRGALVAGAAGAVAVASTTQVPEAAAADGDPLLLGQANAANETTTVTIDGTEGGSDPALTLVNAAGPALRLQPLPATWNGTLRVGDQASTPRGPVTAVNTGTEVVTDAVATLADIDLLPQPIAFTPERALDTRSSRGRVL